MALRPTMAALRCFACRNAVVSAVLGRVAPTIRGLPPVRAFSASQLCLSPEQDSNNRAENLPAGKSLVKAPRRTHKDEQASSKPWFLRVEPPTSPWKPHEVTLPQPPKDAPLLLAPVIKYVYEDMGLDDIALLDLRDLDPTASLGPRLMMVIATARSDRHLHAASGRFVRWLRRNYALSPKADGLMGSNLLRTKLRRLRKRAKLMGHNSMVLPEGDYGLSTDWICVSFATGNSAGKAIMGEVAQYDTSGKVSGFARTHTGTTLAVQCLTEKRRNELDLESLWQAELRESIRRKRRVNGESLNSTEVEAVVSAKLQLPRPTFTSAFQARRQEPLSQQRLFSTLARRLQANADFQSTLARSQPEDVLDDGLRVLQRQIWDMKLRVLPMDLATMERLVTSACLVGSPRENTEWERLAMVDDLLLTGQERGLTIDSPDMLVTLISSLVLSPAYGQKMAKARGNLEAVFLDKQATPTEEHVMRLMDAYARRGLWDRFTEAFRTPARFQVRRSARVYELAYRSLAASQNGVLCKDCLRWIYPEMRQEDPPVLPVGILLERLRECILLADPLVGRERKAFTRDTVLGGRRAVRREFKVMLEDAMEQCLEANVG
ncbi:hypothetical protein L249_3975 [Ophiocordyceps polyrhachis-furcata BCC 54312]|uniref:ATPase synthesis protein 25 n=1 Tax=Ophiocordyceps polyrhachis-furcata BCC 54312 TaxID=1330021 RepID=A0A367L653_9HYPO|nr:hypothetical protein L249_3975 [Ophiocordyceps polyrhachis-furcata BCC 54312]